MKQERVKRGSVAELMIAAQATKYGFMVYFPISHDSKFDMILEKGGKLYRIQSKRTYKAKPNGKTSKESNYVEPRRWTGNKRAFYSKNDYDFLFAYNCETDDCWIIPKNIAMAYKSQILLGDSKEIYKNNWSLLGVKF